MTYWTVGDEAITDPLLPGLVVPYCTFVYKKIFKNKLALCLPVAVINNIDGMSYKLSLEQASKTWSEGTGCWMAFLP